MAARLRGCTPARMQVVERRLEQAAEVVSVPLLWRGARQGGVVERRLEQAAEESSGLFKTFPRSGNVGIPASPVKGDPYLAIISGSQRYA